MVVGVLERCDDGWGGGHGTIDIPTGAYLVGCVGFSKMYRTNFIHFMS